MHDQRAPSRPCTKTFVAILTTAVLMAGCASDPPRQPERSRRPVPTVTPGSAAPNAIPADPNKPTQGTSNTPRGAAPLPPDTVSARGGSISIPMNGSSARFAPAAPENGAPAQDPQAIEASASSKPIALVLPTRSSSFGRAAEAVRDGATAARNVLAPGRELRLFDNDGMHANVLDAYRAATAAGVGAIIGPLTRSEVQWVAAEGNPSVPTVALNTFDGTMPTNLFAISLALDNEARQVAQLAYDEARAADAARTPTAIVVVAAVPFQRRSAQAFAEAFTQAGGRVIDTLEVPANGPITIPPRVKTAQPSLVFAALSPGLGGTLKAGLRNIKMYGTSALNAPRQRVVMLDLEGLRFVDTPWVLERGAPGLAPYMRADQQTRYTAEVERLYALGIDAFHIAMELANGNPVFEFDGATGYFKVRGMQIERRGRAATVRNGVAVSDSAP